MQLIFGISKPAPLALSIYSIWLLFSILQAASHTLYASHFRCVFSATVWNITQFCHFEISSSSSINYQYLATVWKEHIHQCGFTPVLTSRVWPMQLYCCNSTERTFCTLYLEKKNKCTDMVLCPCRMHTHW